MSEKTKNKIKTAFLNTDAVSNGSYSHHDAWIRRNIIVTSGPAFYQNELDTLAQGATVIVYANRVGVVAAGTVLDDRSALITDPNQLASTSEPYEYQRKVAWFADIARNPIHFKVVADLCGTPSRTVRSIVKGKDAILDLVAVHSAEADIAAVKAEYSDNPTETRAWIDARLCQGKYRNDLLALWDGQCAVTGCSLSQVLRASHAIPWCTSSHAQRRDPNNGLPLIASLDALFDRGLIGFSDDGTMLWSSTITEQDRRLFAIPMPLRKKLSEEQKIYLRAHRERFFLVP